MGYGYQIGINAAFTTLAAGPKTEVPSSALADPYSIDPYVCDPLI
jgi:hypothetical protein